MAKNKLDKSWNNSISDWAGKDASLYLLGAEKFQEKAIKAFEKAFISNNYPHLDRLEAINIIKNLKSQ